MKRLDASGLSDWSSEQMPPMLEAPFEDLARMAKDQPQALALVFAQTGDGRGFSAAQRLRVDHQYQGELLAIGPLIPDQVAMAMECGFDALLIEEAFYERHGEAAWLATPQLVRSSYQQNQTERQSIWALRHGASH